MDIKLELLSWAITDAIQSAIEYIHIDTNDAMNTVALVALQEIQLILKNKDIEDDFDVVEEIVRVFEKYHLSTGFRHDFS